MPRQKTIVVAITGGMGTGQSTVCKFLEKYGDLYQTHPPACCYLNKIEPYQKALDDMGAWISGIRRDQTDTREKSPIISHHPFLPVFKINPINT